MKCSHEFMKYSHRFTFELNNENNSRWNFFKKELVCSFKFPEFKKGDLGLNKWGSLFVSYYDVCNKDFQEWIMDVVNPDVDKINEDIIDGWFGRLLFFDDKGDVIDSFQFELSLLGLKFSDLDYSSLCSPTTIALEFKVEKISK